MDQAAFCLSPKAESLGDTLSSACPVIGFTQNKSRDVRCKNDGGACSFKYESSAYRGPHNPTFPVTHYKGLFFVSCDRGIHLFRNSKSRESLHSDRMTDTISLRSQSVIRTTAKMLCCRSLPRTRQKQIFQTEISCHFHNDLNQACHPLSGGVIRFHSR